MSFSNTESLLASEFAVSLVSGNQLAKSILWSDNDEIIFVSNGPYILIFDTESGCILHRLTQHKNDVICLQVNPANCQQLLSTSFDGITHVWDINDFSHLLYVDFRRKISSIALNKANTYILFANGNVIQFPTKIFSNHGQGKLEKYLTGKSTLFSSRNSRNLLLYTSKDEFDFIITFNQKNLIIFSTQSQELHCYEKSRNITCIAVAFDSPTLAFGNTIGNIYIWYNFTSGDENITRLHWHAHAVITLAFTIDGTYLISGGEESVLVVWQIETLKRQFRPRIGGEIRNIAPSKTDQYISVVTSDNIMKVFNSSNLELAFISQNLKHSKWPFGLSPCIPLESLVLHSSPPGWIQIFEPVNQMRQFEIDVTGLNIVSRPYHVQLNYMLITHVAISNDGIWMVTCESRYDEREAFRELRLRFWHYSQVDKSYEQISCVDKPHRIVNMISFSPFLDEPMCATCGEEGEFIIWALTEERKDDETNFLWRCYASERYNGQRATHCIFSSDASIIALAYKSTITLWEIETMDLRETLDSILLREYVKCLKFGSSDRFSFLMASTEYNIIVWDLVSCRVAWSAAVSNTVLCTSPYTHFVVAISNKSYFIFDPNYEVPILEIENTMNARIIDACFLGKDGKIAVYVLTENHEIFCLHDMKTFDFMKLKDSNVKKPESIFDDLLIGPAYTPYSVENTSLFKKVDLSVFDTPCHILPPPKNYGWNVIREFLEQRKISPNIDEFQENNIEEEIQVDSIDYKKQTVVKSEERKVIRSIEGDESIDLDFSWLDSFFRSSEFVPS